jgi:hypothetical protein
MATIVFTQNLERHVHCPRAKVAGDSVREALTGYFEMYPAAAGYVLDDQSALRHHMVIFVDGEQIRDRAHLSDPVNSDTEIYVMQALSGGCRE